MLDKIAMPMEGNSSRSYKATTVLMSLTVLECLVTSRIVSASVINTNIAHAMVSVATFL